MIKDDMFSDLYNIDNAKLSLRAGGHDERRSWASSIHTPADLVHFAITDTTDVARRQAFGCRDRYLVTADRNLKMDLINGTLVDANNNTLATCYQQAKGHVLVSDVHSLSIVEVPPLNDLRLKVVALLYPLRLKQQGWTETTTKIHEFLVSTFKSSAYVDAVIESPLILFTGKSDYASTQSTYKTDALPDLASLRKPPVAGIAMHHKRILWSAEFSNQNSCELMIMARAYNELAEWLSQTASLNIEGGFRFDTSSIKCLKDSINAEKAIRLVQGAGYEEENHVII